MKSSRRWLMSAIGAGIALAGVVNGQTNTFPSSGSVGIGTTSPIDTLEVAGGIHTSGTAAASKASETWLDYFNHGTRLTAMGPDTATMGTISLRTASSDSLIVGVPLFVDASDNINLNSGQIYLQQSTGHVGIGTTTPSTTLDIEVNGVPTLAIGQLGGDFSVHYGANLTDTAYRPFLSYSYDGTNGNSTTLQSPESNGYVKSTQTAGVQIGTAGIERLRIDQAGNVGIGTTTPDQALAVNGTVHAKEVIVDNTGWPDWVFSNRQQLPSLVEVERTIREQKHLPGMPSSKDVAMHGVSLGSMEAKLLAQVEQLTLHVIEQEKELARQQDRANQQEIRIRGLEDENNRLRKTIMP